MLDDHQVAAEARTLAYGKNRSHILRYCPAYAKVQKQVLNTFLILSVINKFSYGIHTLLHTLVRRERREILCMHRILRRA